MARWLLAFLLLASCSGCMALDDMIFGDYSYDHPPAPTGECGVPPGHFRTPQTTEPPVR